MRAETASAQGSRRVAGTAPPPAPAVGRGRHVPGNRIRHQHSQYRSRCSASNVSLDPIARLTSESPSLGTELTAAGGARRDRVRFNTCLADVDLTVMYSRSIQHAMLERERLTQVCTSMF
jgi:hypothetical protein